MEYSSNKLSQQDILSSVEDWVLSLSELSSAIRNKLDKTLVWDIPLESIPMIEEFKELPWKNEIKKFQKIEDYLNNISHLRNESSKPILKESNWKTYLVLWQDDIFEVIEQKWPTYIAYHPVRQIYIVYNFVSEDSDENTILLWWLDSIDEMEIDWYYKVSSSHEEVFIYLNWIFKEKQIIIESSYYYIWENWETQDFWNFRRVWELQKHWNAVFFIWEDISYNRKIVIYNWDKIKPIPDWYENTRKSKSGRNLLHILYNFPGDNTISALFDLDKMEFIFEWANRFNFNISFPDDDVWTFEDEISWEFHEKREWFARLLGKRVTRHNATL